MVIVVGKEEVKVDEESVIVVGIDEVKTVCTNEVEDEAPASSVLELEGVLADVVLDDSDVNVPDGEDKLEVCDEPGPDDENIESVDVDDVETEEQRAHPVLRQIPRS